jgi:hypothetical protein
VGVLAAAAAVGAGVALTRPWSADDVAASPAATPAPPATPSSSPLVAPLTGLPLTAPLDHAAVAIKVSDVRHAHPQVGVDHADLVFVEPIGVSYTRLAAVFHSDLPDEVGPVRSVRPMDAPLLSPIAPVFGHTMAAHWVMNYVRDVGTLESWGSLEAPSGSADPYRVDPSRGAPDHVFADPAKLLALGEHASAPEPYVDYAPDAAHASAAVAGDRGSSVTVPYGPGWDVTWTYDADDGKYLRAQPWGKHVMADGTQIAATNVLVLEVSSTVTKLAPGSGAPVPVLDVIDAGGPLVALAGGHSVRGTWSKGAVRDRFDLRTEDGQPLLLAPGNTWVELPAPHAGVEVR